MSKILIGIPSYRCYGFARICVESILLNTDVPFDLLVIDNATDIVPEDPTTTYYKTLEQQYSNFRLISTPGNLGCAISWNTIIEEGFKSKDYDYIAIFNSDIVTTPNWASKILKAFNDYPEYSVFAPMEINTAEIEHITLPNLTLNRLFCQNAKKEILEDPKEVYKNLNYIYNGSFYKKALEFESKTKDMVIPGAGFSSPIYRKDAFEKVGYYDERFYPSFFEDSDFTVRADQVGVKSAKTGTCFFHHFGNITTNNSGYFTNRAIHETMGRRFHDKWANPKDYNCLRESCRSNKSGMCTLGFKDYKYPNNSCPSYQFSLTKLIEKNDSIRGKDVLEEDVR